MGRKLNFVIACEVIDNIRLMKPFGMIPYTMQKHYGFNSTVVTYKNGDYPYLHNELNGLNIKFLQHYLYKKAKWPFLLYLAFNARKIDVLMTYNIKKRPIYYGLIYKLFNPKGFLYAKADTSQPYFGFYVENANILYKRWMTWLGKIFLSKCDCVSVESKPVFSAITQVDKNKLLLIPCGFDPDIADHLGVRKRSFAEKENIVLHVARLGVPQKNSEMLLEAIANMNIPKDWKFVFIGSSTNDFSHKYEAFCKNHPEKAERIILTGPIEDKSVLFDYYSRSKIFCLPSLRETFGNVLTEALYFGNAIAGSSHIPSIVDLVDDHRNGILFDAKDPKDICEKLSTLMNDNTTLCSNSEHAIEYAHDNLIWKDVLSPLNDLIATHYRKVQ